MRNYRQLWRGLVRDALVSMLRDAGLPGDVPADALTPETPPNPELGDIAFPVFAFAKLLRKGPPQIAQEVARRLGAAAAAGTAGSPPRGTVSAAGPYVNIRLDRPAVTSEVLDAVSREGDAWGRSDGLAGRRYFVEFSCPNTNKPLHIGHLRNDALGESLSRILAAAGAEVLKANLINDRGVHICKSMLAYRMFGGATTPATEGIKGDHFVGDYYVKYAGFGLFPWSALLPFSLVEALRARGSTPAGRFTILVATWAVVTSMPDSSELPSLGFDGAAYWACAGTARASSDARPAADNAADQARATGRWYVVGHSAYLDCSRSFFGLLRRVPRGTSLDRLRPAEDMRWRCTC